MVFYGTCFVVACAHAFKRENQGYRTRNKRLVKKKRLNWFLKLPMKKRKKVKKRKQNESFYKRLYL